MKSTEELDSGGLVVGLAMLAVAGWVFWESQTYTELAAAFPRTVALVMALASAALIGRCLLRRQRRGAVEGGSRLHRGALFAALVGWLVLVPLVGFVVASVLGFVACGLTARYERWPPGRWIGFVALAVAAVAAFYGLFSEVLQVPFPQGRLL